MSELFKKMLSCLFRTNRHEEESVSGSHCGCCGKWCDGDQGDPYTPRNWSWTLCEECSSL